MFCCVHKMLCMYLASSPDSLSCIVWSGQYGRTTPLHAPKLSRSRVTRGRLSSSYAMKWNKYCTIVRVVLPYWSVWSIPRVLSVYSVSNVRVWHVAHCVEFVFVHLSPASTQHFELLVSTEHYLFKKDCVILLLQLMKVLYLCCLFIMLRKAK